MGPTGSDERAVPIEPRTARAAAAVLRAARSWRAAATALLAEPDRLRDSAREQYEAARRHEVRGRLREMPVSRLREAATGRLRLGELERSGFRTVADVADAGPDRLRAVPGVGPATARDAVAAAERISQVTAQDTVVRLDPDRRDSAHTGLLATLRAWEVAGEQASAQRDAARRGVGELDELEPVAHRTGSRFRMLLTGRRGKATAREALGRLEDLLADPSADRVRAAADEAVGAEARQVPDELWRDYQRRAATYNTLLSELTGHASTDARSATGHLPPEQERQVTSTSLDTRLMRVALRGYQAFGAKFALARRRCILGDEMGLGKTVEALAAMAHLAAGGARHFLVVCPASVLINWVEETARHSALVPHPLHGPTRDADAREWLRDGGVAVTTFDTLQRLRLDSAPLAMVVVDEAHYIKNPQAKRSQAVVSVVAGAGRALLLTGTPMENRVEEFRTLVGYLQPEVARQLDARDALSPNRFRRAVAPAYLRRNQQDVLTELPELIELEDWVELGGTAESRAYLAGVRDGNMMAMRRAAYASSRSAKLERLREIVEDAAAEQWKVVVFTNFLDVIDTVRAALGPAVMPLALTGALSARGKQDLIDEFTEREGHAVLLAQILAGGTGLNIQAANVVILAEPQLKPSTEDQAIARCHRMGQTRKVHVHRILAKDSVDERLTETLVAKSEIFDAYARESTAKLADPEALNTAPLAEAQHDGTAAERRIVAAERHRLGLG
ncbi:DEAD/DEAH box helicase [Saccharopolyspora gloriosae]|uniref:Superfamily II DNA or RNA helicase n=1 Tax=Saccharopolyspora gloriosae TaxID=455344 RepID=A0A840NA29_9PSEU|nr:SNF2-related protein [Saccharopolyspora gloriosae]MBB5069066.1 superfamily II DNA or RNA helicase [Saccharopolyspora gloriosae]